MKIVEAGVMATSHDCAKLGEPVRLDGQSHGKQLVPGAWVRVSSTPDAPDVLSEANPATDFPLGYGYQCWMLGDVGASAGELCPNV